MQNEIKKNIENADQLEKLYRADTKGFKKAFDEIYNEIANLKISEFWKARLDYDNIKENISSVKKMDILILILSCFVSGFLIKIPQILDFKFEEFLFYERNSGLIVLFGLSVYSFLMKDKTNKKYLAISLFVFSVSAIFINLLPAENNSDSIILVFFHLPLMIWCLYGIIFIDFDLHDKTKRIDYIKYNGDLAILVAIILITGGILTGVTLGLFSAIEFEIEKFYLDYIAIWGLVSAPIVATYIIKIYPSVTNRIAPIIANIFTPLVLITLIIYLISILTTGKDLYTDREFLIVFNLMLLGVMALIVFSVPETSLIKRQRIGEYSLLALSIITLLIDLFALSAIIYRVGEFGFTPNRTAVLGSNILIFGNLLLIMIDLFKVNFGNENIKKVELTIAKYLPVYALWTLFVVFVLPFIFKLK